MIATGNGGVWYPVGTLRKMRHLIAKHNLQQKFISNDDECLHAVADLLGLPMINMPSCMVYGFHSLGISRNDVGALHGLWTQCNGVRLGGSKILQGDLLYHAIFSHRFPEYGNRNAYEAMNMVPNPDVLKVLNNKDLAGS